jgi:hypothetical protein
VKRDVRVGFGDFISDPYEPSWRPASGWVWTSGDNGVVEWEGSFYGQLGWCGIFPYIHLFTGATNFSGIRIRVLHPLLGYPSYYFGIVKHICLGPSWFPRGVN